ncbi:putative acetyl-CoA carboxylase [Helianthus annuus]|nr:putative acetyl-CoA carboxylase [Helianthus annuus]
MLLYLLQEMESQIVELHGDLAGYEDATIVTRIGTIDGGRNNS